MTVVFRALGRDDLADVLTLDGTFTVEAELLPSARDGAVTYEIKPVPAYRKRYADNVESELADFIDAPDKMFLLAHVEGRLAGHVSVAVHWNRYAFIDHLLSMPRPGGMAWAARWSSWRSAGRASGACRV